jgi:transcriptional regulator with XRE-family HTH domain
MTHQDLVETIRDARRAKRLRQGDIAKVIGCSQAAVSRYESGRPDALSRAHIEQIAKYLGVEVNEQMLAATEVRGTQAVARHAFCAWVFCPSCIPYRLNGRLVMLPTLIEEGAGEDRKACDLCGEPLQKGCPGCGAPLVGRAFCDNCNAPLVEVEQGMKDEILRQRRECDAEAVDLREASAEVTGWQRATDWRRLRGHGR